MSKTNLHEHVTYEPTDTGLRWECACGEGGMVAEGEMRMAQYLAHADAVDPEEDEDA